MIDNKKILKYILASQKKNKRVFLGGTCNGSTWRSEIIKKLKIDYFNPVVDDWTDEDQKKELVEREKCDYCLYVITPAMTGVYSIAEVVDDSNKRPEKTIFCVLNHYDNDSFSITERTSFDMVKKMVEDNSAYVFNNLDDVVNFLNTGDIPNEKNNDTK